MFYFVEETWFHSQVLGFSDIGSDVNIHSTDKLNLFSVIMVTLLNLWKLISLILLENILTLLSNYIRTSK